jgi:hypothetical protein
MDHDTTTTDIDALEAEVNALLEQDAAMAQRLDALLARTTTHHAMTDYDMHDLIRDQLTGIYVDLTTLGLMPEQYDQRLTQALQLLRDARALLEECRG